MRLVCALVAVAAFTLAACKKDQSKPRADQGGSAAAQPAEPVAPAVDPKLAAVLPKKSPAAFATWDVLARAKAWQGAWVTEQSLGSPIAIEINGSAATVWDGKQDKRLELALESPCSAKLTERSADGSSSSTTLHYTIKNGALVTGLGDAGSRSGKTAIACVGNAVLTLDQAGTCLSWESMFDEWKSTPGKCGFAQADGKDTFVATVSGMDTTLIVDGDALLSEQLANKSAKSYPDFAAAKAARDAATP